MLRKRELAALWFAWVVEPRSILSPGVFCFDHENDQIEVKGGDTDVKAALEERFKDALDVVLKNLLQFRATLKEEKRYLITVISLFQAYF